MLGEAAAPANHGPSNVGAMRRLTIVGGGRMGEAMLAGLLAADWGPPTSLVVVEPSADRAAELGSSYPGVEVRAAAGGPDETPADAILAVKPPLVARVARTLGELGVRRMISLAAGVRLATIESEVPAGCAVIRAMPNTAALVRAGAIAIAGGGAAEPDDLDWAEELLSAVGTVVRLAESHLDAVTGLSGSGPAYVFLIAEALTEAGVLNGLDRQTATTLADQTLLGAARLLTETDQGAANLRAAVTSPGGTTAAGLAVLERAGVRAALLDAVTASRQRSEALG